MSNQTVDEIRTFYTRYHSLRFVGRQLVIRIKAPILGEQLTQLHTRFEDLLTGSIGTARRLPEELEEPGLKDYSRIVFSLIDGCRATTPTDRPSEPVAGIGNNPPSVTSPYYPSLRSSLLS